MRSTGEVMGIDPDYAMAFAKSQAAAGNQLPTEGSIFISISDSDKPAFIPIARNFAAMGFKLIATPGTAAYLRKHDIECQEIQKISVGRPNVSDLVANNEIAMIVNTFTGFQARADERLIRTMAIHASCRDHGDRGRKAASEASKPCDPADERQTASGLSPGLGRWAI